MTWKEPKGFSNKYRPCKIFYGWVQFRIFLYLIAAVMGCWGLGMLDPNQSVDAPGLIAVICLSLFLGFFVAYGLPLLSRLAPSFVQLYSNYLAVSRGLHFLYFPFNMVSGYKLTRESDGWFLRLTDLDQQEGLIAIPTEEIKMKVEAELSASGVPRHVLGAGAIATRKDASLKFQERLKAYTSAARRHDLDVLPWYFGFLIAFVILTFTANHYFSINPTINIFGIVILFAGIIRYGIIESNLKRRSARTFGLVCLKCENAAIRTDYLQIVARTHACPYCGMPFYKIAD